MVVYVDDMYTMPMGRYRGMKMSHMIADTEAELHAMADKIGVQRRWFQQVPSGNHYDIAMSKRAAAVAAGAVEITVRQTAAICWCLRTGRPYDSPDNAWLAYQEHLRRHINATEPTLG